MAFLDSLPYYEICFYLSVALTIAYIAIWHKGFDVNITCLFILLPIVNLGCIWMYWAPNQEVAIIANKLVYLAGCFWPLLSTRVVLSLCHVKVKPVISVLTFVLSFVFYGFALTSDQSGPLYRSIDFKVIDGRYVMYPVYGWMHTVIYLTMVINIIIGIIALIYAMKNKFRTSFTNMWLMLGGEFFTAVVFFIFWLNDLQGSPAIAYVLTQVILLIVGYRSYFYDVDESVMDTIVVEGKLGYLTFDKRKCLLGCSVIADRMFPELATVRADMPLDNDEGIKGILKECMSSLEKDGKHVNRIYPREGKFIQIRADLYRLRGVKTVYRFIIDDDTDHQNLVALLSKEKDVAEQKTKQVSDALYRYVDPSVADRLLSDEADAMSEGVDMNVTVMFADIRGFTSFSEGRPPRETLKALNMIIETATSAIMENGGTVDKIIGDCVMAIWNIPENESEGAYLACKAAYGIQKAMKELNVQLVKEFGVELPLGIGINYGHAIVGNVGTEKRSDYTAIGDVINIASRLESVAERDETLVTDDVAKLLEGRAEFSPIEKDVTLKGRSGGTQVLKLMTVK